jgi:hypothetical protein
MIFTVYGQRYHPFEAIVDAKTGEVVDDGQPKRIKLAGWADKKISDHFAENVKNSVAKRSWKIWVE